jgi:hypothetical protein
VFGRFNEHESFLGRYDHVDDDGIEHLFDALLNDGKGGFTMDGRGAFERDWILNEEDYLAKFKDQMALHHRKLSVDLTTKCVNDVMFKDVILERLEGFGIKLPVPKKTVWKWTRKCGGGGVSGACEKHYYNDKRQDPDTIKCRDKHVATLKRLEKRTLTWVEIDAAEDVRLSALKGELFTAGLLLPRTDRLKSLLASLGFQRKQWPTRLSPQRVVSL